jgi:hypothetical protein
VIAAVLILVVAALYAVMGLFALAAPGQVLQRFGVSVETHDGRNEVRAVYGGFGLVVAGMLIYAAFTSGRGALWIPSIVALSLIGMAAGRLISMVLDRTRGSRLVWLFLIIEVVTALMLFAAHTQYPVAADYPQGAGTQQGQ